MRTYNQECDSWNQPCDHSLKLRCLSSGEGTSCLTGYPGTRCTCISTDYWDDTSCVPKLLDKVITDNGCKCRHDLGLQRLPFQSPYTCYVDNNPSQQCACPNDQYWGGEKCVPKKSYSEYCTTDCQCKENLLLSCEPYVNGYTCYSDFGSGLKCLCNYITHWWNDGIKKCGNINCLYYFNSTDLSILNYKDTKYSYGTACDNTCQCRNDLGFTCRTPSNTYSCLNDFSTTRCDCNDFQYSSGGTCGKINFSFINGFLCFVL